MTVATLLRTMNVDTMDPCRSTQYLSIRANSVRLTSFEAGPLPDRLSSRLATHLQTLRIRGERSFQ